MPEDASRVRVRIGTFDTDDHERRAGLLLDHIEARLGIDSIVPEPAVEEASAELRIEA